MNITKQRTTWFGISATLVLASIISVFVFGMNLGLDFTGGARWSVQFDNPGITSGQISSFFENQDLLTQSAQIQKNDEGTFLITVEDLSDGDLQALANNMKDTFGAFEQKSYQKVDSRIGESFRQKSVSAIIVALIGIIFFVAYAFRKIPAAINPWRFGGVAIAALFHDIIIILGVFVLLGAFFDIELNLQFITALLATLGFSVNDTIVILDRVRENIHRAKKGETFEDTIEKSIQQTFMRSINTSISTLLPLLALFIFGAVSIQFFILALILGIVVGTYSSIFLAAPLLVTWKDMAKK